MASEITEADLQKLKNELIEAVTKIVKENSAELEKHINDVYNIRFEVVQKDVDRHQKYHDEHFKEFDNVRKEITESRESILKDLKTGSRDNVSKIIAIGAVVVSIAAIIISNWPG